MAYNICTNCRFGVIHTERAIEKCPVCNGYGKIPIYDLGSAGDMISVVPETPVMEEIPATEDNNVPTTPAIAPYIKKKKTTTVINNDDAESSKEVINDEHE